MFFVPDTDMIQYHFGLIARPLAITEQSLAGLENMLIERLSSARVALFPSTFDHRVDVGITVDRATDDLDGFMDILVQVNSAVEAALGHEAVQSVGLVGIDPA